MSNSSYYEASISNVFYRAAVPLIFTWLLISLTFVVPLLDSTHPPYPGLNNFFSEIAYWLALSGGKYGAPVIGVVMLFFFITRKESKDKKTWQEATVIVLLSSILAGGGAAINEHIIKTELKISRPNIIWLAGDNGFGPLGMQADQFYELGNKEVRRKPLMKVLTQQPAPIALSSSVESHWVEETGYSFPSGHAFSAMFFASFLLAMAITYITTKRIWIFYALLPWALAVCYSRTILRVHTPLDVTVGGFQGMVVGLVAWFIARVLLRKFGYKEL